jgi:hypothetical protein
MGYSLDNQPQVTVTENITLSNLDNGSHTITVFAENEYWDILGASETIHFTISDSPKPFPTTLVLASAALSVTGVSGVVVVYFKRKR